MPSPGSGVGCKHANRIQHHGSYRWTRHLPAPHDGWAEIYKKLFVFCHHLASLASAAIRKRRVTQPCRSQKFKTGAANLQGSRRRSHRSAVRKHLNPSASWDPGPLANARCCPVDQRHCCEHFFELLREERSLELAAVMGK